MDEQYATYLPFDRLQALARGEGLPPHTVGAALFADVSGFTPLTEALARSLGPRRGAEELTDQINRVYDALIDELHNYGGSVIGFAGDAITCWLDEREGPAAARAATCALAMQQAMQAFGAVQTPDGQVFTLAVKIAIAYGPVWRFIVGDPNIQLIDCLAGATVARMAEGEHLANKGEILLDAASLASLGAQATLAEWRMASETGESFAVLTALTPLAAALESKPFITTLSPEQLRPWLLQPVYERLQAGLGEYLTELRPAVALFMRFGRFDYEHDPEASHKVDLYLRWAQQVVNKFGGAIVQLTIGDKGHYLYASFGALLVHEDDVRRAANAALELRQLPPDLAAMPPPQIGLTRGLMRAGAYGSMTRRLYGAMSDEVNLAARLMQNAKLGEILAHEPVWQALAHRFVWEALPPLRVKGKADPIRVARLLGENRAMTKTSIFYQGALVGREGELQQIMTFANPLWHGQFAGVLTLSGEPGIGKSRLLHEARQHLAHAHPLTWLVASADGLVAQSLHPFQRLAHDYFDQHAGRPEAENKAHFETVWRTLVEFLQALPADQAPEALRLATELERTHTFLGALAGELHWPGSLYEQAEPQLRLANTLIALKTLFLAESLRQPVALHLEDLQWFDADSLALVRELTRNVAAYPLALIAASRYDENGHPLVLGLDDAIPQVALDLNHLTDSGTHALAQQLLGRPIAAEVGDWIVAKTNGNPFFVEQLTRDLQERHLLDLAARPITFRNAPQVAEIPADLNAVLIARLDRLTGHIKAVVQTAAVLGQEFEVAVLAQMLRDRTHLRDYLQQGQISAIWAALSELRYLFKHGLLRDAAYAMQLHARLRELHALAGHAIETLYAHELPARAADLAYHYQHAEDRPRERRFARLAGEYAAARYANADAVRYFTRAWALTAPEAEEDQWELALALEGLYHLLGQRAAQTEAQARLTRLAEQRPASTWPATAALRRGALAEVTGDYAPAIAEAQHAIALAARAPAEQSRLEAEGYLLWGRALWQKSDYTAAPEPLQHALARAAAHPKLEADCWRQIGLVASDQGQYAAAREATTKALERYRAANDGLGLARCLGNLGNLAADQNDPDGARAYYLQAQQAFQRIGERWGMSYVLNNLGVLACEQKMFGEAIAYYQQALRAFQDIGDHLGVARADLNLGNNFFYLGDYDVAPDYWAQASHTFRALERPLGEARVLDMLGLLATTRGDFTAALAYAQQALALAQTAHSAVDEAAMHLHQAHALSGLGRWAEAQQAYAHALNIRRSLKQPNLAMEALAGLARVALARGDVAQAQGYVLEIMQHLATHAPAAAPALALAGTDDAFGILLTCSRALPTQSQAQTLLAHAHAQLQQYAAQFAEPRQQLFLNNVPSHRALRAAWQAQQGSAA
jgi:class 3 adenylate cyclase/tetratricopeptide (TPR) repeat protein